MTFDDLTADARELLDLRPDGWTKELMWDCLKLAEETGEVAECFTKSEKTLEDLGEEISDVMIVCSVIALRNGLDLSKICRDKQRKRAEKLVMKYHNGNYPTDRRAAVAATKEKQNAI